MTGIKGLQTVTSPTRRIPSGTLVHRTSSFVKNDAELFGPFRSWELFGGPAPQGIISTWSTDLPPSARFLRNLLLNSGAWVNCPFHSDQSSSGITPTAILCESATI